MVFVQWGVGDGSWRGAGGNDDMVGSGVCQWAEGLGWGYGGGYWSLSELGFEVELSVGCAYRLGGLGIATILLRLLS